MNAAIGITAYNRPDCLRACLWGLDQQMPGPWNEWPIYLHIDGGGCKPALAHNIARRSKSMAERTTIRVEADNLGINRNTYGTMTWAFDELGYDWAVYLEDDCVPLPDALRLAAWYIEHAGEIAATWSVEGIGVYCLGSFAGGDRPAALQLSRAFIGWGFLISRAQFEAVRAAWLVGEATDPPSMWDRWIARKIRALSPHHYNVMPEMSRVANIGVYGEHHTPESHRLAVARMTTVTDAAEYRYAVDGWDEAARAHRQKYGLGDEPPPRPEHPPGMEK